MPKSPVRANVNHDSRQARFARLSARVAVSVAVVAVALAATHGVARDEPLAVVATTGMVADVVREVGGECVAVSQLMGPGIDPHLYRASASDVARLERAELIVYNGFNLEGQLGAVLSRIGARTETLALAEAIAARAGEEVLLEGEDEFEGQADPHLWGDAALWAVGAEIVAERLSTMRPACATDITARAEAYRASLEALHAWAAESLASVPEGQRTLITSHDAFEYFGAAYGLEVAGIEGISTESEASIADIRETADLVIESGVRAIFVETTISPRTIEAVQAAVRDRGGDVVIGGVLYGDAMGDLGSAEGTYVGMLRANVATIVAALGGTIAPWPDALAGWAEAWELE